MFEKIDPYMRDIETLLKLPTGVTSRQLVPEIMSRIVEIPIDVIANDITAAKVMKGILGLFFALAPQQIGPMIARDWDRTPGYTGRDSEDTFAMAKMWLLEMTDPTADDLVKIATAIQNIRQGFAFNDPARIARVFGAKSWAEIQADWTNVANAFGTAFGIPGAKPAAKTAAAGAGPAPALYRETLSGPGAARAAPAGQPAPSAIPGIPSLFRFTSDHAQPGAPGVATRFRLTLG